jgi:aspartyl aminopeptidase
MFDTFFYGDVDWKSWLVTPMALHVYAARPGSSSGDVDLVIGEAETDPVLSIPDLLPHLSGKAQRKQVVDSPERLDAIAAGSRAALDTFLSSQGIDVRTFEDAEVYLLPAGPAVFVGVDRGLIAGYGHSHRALAFAATRALLAEEAPEYTSAVILISNSEIGTGASGPAFIQTALSRVLGALSKDGSDTDVLDTRRAYARSAVLMSARIEAAERNKGIAMNTRADDALPDATRRAIDRMTSTGAQVQVTFDKSWQSQTRKLAALDMDAVGIGLPTTGHGTPMELISVLDLYSGHLALRGWMTAK